MRQRLAVGISILTVCVLVALSVLFAVRQNPATPGASLAAAAAAPVPPPAASPLSEGQRSQAPQEPPAAAAQEDDSLAGLRVFQKSGCARCHSVAGAGSPRNPLDGVGSRRSRAELRAWTIGAEALQDSLSPSALRAKRAFAQMPEADIRALVAYLATLVER